MEMTSANALRGDYNAYSAHLAAVLAREVTISPEQLMGFLPAETPRGTVSSDSIKRNEKIHRVAGRNCFVVRIGDPVDCLA